MAGSCLTAGGAGCLFVPAFALTSLVVGSRCPIVWIIGLPFVVVAIGLVWPISALVVYLADHILHPSGEGAGADAREAAVDTADAAANIVVEGADVDVLSNRRVRFAILGALGVAIGIPLMLALSRSSVDANGLPLSPTGGDLLARPEVQLLPPGSSVYNQQVYPASCAPNGEVYTDLSSSQPADAVYRWYDAWLLGHGWKLTERLSPSGGYPAAPTIDVKYGRGPREVLRLTAGGSAYGPTHGVYRGKPALPNGTRSTFEVNYTLGPAK